VAALHLARESDAGSPGEVQLQIVKRKGLDEELKKLRGQVVVLDVWADFCRPCKQEFPHLVALHKKYAGKGLGVRE
jgi:thiol-disulfide isomerase/thioredoxin